MDAIDETVRAINSRLSHFSQVFAEFQAIWDKQQLAYRKARRHVAEMRLCSERTKNRLECSWKLLSSGHTADG